MRELTGEVVVRGLSGSERDDCRTSIERFDVGCAGDREVVVVNTGNSCFGGLEIFSFLIEVSLGSCNARREMFGEGDIIDPRPGDKISIFYSLCPCGDGRASTAAM